MNLYLVIPLFVVGVAALFGAGYWWRCRQTVVERYQLRARRQVLDIEWTALARVQRLAHLQYWGQQQMSDEERRLR